VEFLIWSFGHLGKTHLIKFCQY